MNTRYNKYKINIHLDYFYSFIKKISNQIKFEFFYFCNNKQFLLTFNSSNLFIFHFDWNFLISDTVFCMLVLTSLGQ
jgi:hypothetical protein